MAKKNKDSIIALEIEKYEKKIKEYQDYLTKHSDLDLEGDNKYKEADLQFKLMNCLPTWLEALKKLKQEAENSSIELRGESEVNDVFRIMKK
jgi:hypothetical protein